MDKTESERIKWSNLTIFIDRMFVQKVEIAFVVVIVVVLWVDIWAKISRELRFFAFWTIKKKSIGYIPAIYPWLYKTLNWKESQKQYIHMPESNVMPEIELFSCVKAHIPL